MEIFRTLFSIKDDTSGEIRQCDTIQHEGGIWLVPRWLENREKTHRQPVRIVRIDIYQNQISGDLRGPMGLVLNRPLHKELFDPDDLSPDIEAQYEIRDRPALSFSIPTLH